MTDQNYMLGAMLRVPFQAIVDNIYATLMAAGYTDLRPSHFIVFQQITPAGVQATTLARKAQITKQSMSYLVTYLEQHGYLEKFNDPTDGRAQLLRLTKKGKDVERLARESIAHTQSEWEEAVGAAKMKQLLTTLDQLVNHIENS